MPARKTTSEADAAPVEAHACSNCGLPATQQTTNPGANVDYYCDSCADQVYPKPWPVKHLDTDLGDPLEPISA